MTFLGRAGKVVAGMSNLRSLVVVLSLAFLLTPSVPSILKKPIYQSEQWLFRLGLDLRDKPVQQTKITIVHVPDIEYDRWMEDLTGAISISDLIKKILDPNLTNDTRSTVGLLLERPLTLIQSEAEMILSEIHQGRRTKEVMYEESKALFERRDLFTEQLKSPHVVLGIPNQLGFDLPAVDKMPSDISRYPLRLSEWLWPSLPRIHADKKFGPSALVHYPIFLTHVNRAHLLWQQGNEIHLNFVSAFLAAAHRPVVSDESTPDDSVTKALSWTPGQQVRLYDFELPLDTDGGFMPLYGDYSGIRSSLRQMTLGAALQQDDIDGWVLVGRDGSPVLDKLAQTIAAANDEAILLQPVWWQPIQKILALALMVFFILLMPVLSLGRSLMATVAVVIVLLIFNVYAHAKMNAWLPSGFLISYMVLAWVLMAIWVSKQRETIQQLNQIDDVGLRYAKELIAQNKYDQAFEVVKGCRSNPYTLETLYSISEYYEDSGKLEKTLDVLHELKRRKKRYQNVHRKVKSLEVFLQTTLGIGHQTSRKFLENQGESPDKSDTYEDAFEKTKMLSGPAPKSKAHSHFGRYEVKRELGRGASGVVFLAYDPTISRDVAIKTLNYQQFSKNEQAEVRERFFREAKATGRLSHPNIVQIFDMGEQGNLAYIAMDYARGRPLSEYTNPETLLPVKQVYLCVLKVARALEYAHAQGVIHRDIKPSNILFCEETEQVKVTDLGIAHLMDHSHTRTGEILGSPLYMAPEQLLGKKVNHSSDIFSLGVMFYQLLSGRLPFMGDNLASLTYEIIHTRHVSVRSFRKELPSSAVRITNTALQKQPTARYRSAHDMTEALVRALKRDFGIDA